MTRDIMGGPVVAVAAIVVYMACSINPVTGGGPYTTAPTCQNPSDAATLADFNVTPRDGTQTVADNSFKSGPKRNARAKFNLKIPGLFTPVDLDLRFSNVKEIRVHFVPKGKRGGQRRRTEVYKVGSLDSFSVPMDTAADPIIRMVVNAVPENRKDVVGLQVDKFTACKIRAVPTTTASLPSETTAPTSLPSEPTTEPQSRYGYVGCFPKMNSEVYMYKKSYVSLEVCRKYCKSKNAKYLAMVAGYFCDCENVIDLTTAVNDTECSDTCLDDESLTCGGLVHDSVYTVVED